MTPGYGTDYNEEVGCSSTAGWRAREVPGGERLDTGKSDEVRWQSRIELVLAENPWLDGRWRPYVFRRSQQTRAEQEALRDTGQQLWSLTRLAAHQRHLLLDVVRNSTDALRARLSEASSLVDLGAGSGLGTAAMLQSLSMLRPICTPLPSLLVDRNRQALCQGLARVKCSFGTITQPVSLEADILDTQLWAAIPDRQVVFLASGVIHELPLERKRFLLQRIAERPKSVLALIEFSADHDLAETGSTELIRESAALYQHLLRDTEASVSIRRHDASLIEEFLLSEMSDVWYRPYDQRRNFHMTHDQWVATIESSGMSVVDSAGCPDLCKTASTLVMIACTRGE